MDQIYDEFKRIHGYELNLKNPCTFSEKIQWIKLYGNIERFAKYTDKYEVRQFIKELVGERYLIPLIGVYETVNDIPFEPLPKSFIMKATHGSDWNIIVKDKSMIDWGTTSKQMHEWMNTNYYELWGELNYKPLKGRVVIEELLEDPSGDLKDYKFFCFHGNPMFIQVDGDRFTEHKRDIYNLRWEKLPLRLLFSNLRDIAEKPKYLAEMVEIAGRLSRMFAFVRVDLYCTNERIYFGELTIAPGSGLERFDPVEFDEEFGESLDLGRYY